MLDATGKSRLDFPSAQNKRTFGRRGMRTRNTLETLRQNYGTLLPADIARTKKIRHSSRKRPNRNFAMAAAPAAMPVNPNNAATIAIIRKITAQRNIVSPPQS